MSQCHCIESVAGLLGPSTLARYTFFALLSLTMNVTVTPAQEVQVLVPIEVQGAGGVKAKQAMIAKWKTPDFLKPIINGELSFIKRVCRPTVGQMKEIVAEATIAFDAMVGIVQDQNQAIVNGANQMIMGPNNQRLSENPYTRIRLDAAKYLRGCVSPEQYQDYVNESKLRVDYDQSAAILAALTIIDQKVSLNDKQYQELNQALLNEWTDVNLMQLQNYVHNPQYVPKVPEKALKEVLSKTQYDVWKTYQNANMWMTVGYEKGIGDLEKWIK